MTKIVFVIISVCISGFIWLKILMKNDKIEPEPIFTVLRIGLIGGIVSGILAGIGNDLFSSLTGIDHLGVAIKILPAIALALFVGLNEEFLKSSLAIFLLKKQKNFNEPVDGMIYSVAISLGFAVFENFYYVYSHGYGVLIARSLLSVPGHMAFAAIWGYGISVAKFKYSGKGYFRVVFPYMIMAALVHGFYDFLCFVISGGEVIIALVPIVVMSYMYGTKRMRELVSKSNFLKVGECSKCRTQNEQDDKYCKSCGNKIIVENDFFKICPKCSAKTKLNGAFCSKCGYKYEKSEEDLKCTQCGKNLKLTDKFCPDCGEKLE